MRIIGNDQKNNGENFWEILERIIGKIASIIYRRRPSLTSDYHSFFVALKFLLKICIRQKAFQIMPKIS